MPLRRTTTFHTIYPGSILGLTAPYPGGTPHFKERDSELPRYYWLGLVIHVILVLALRYCVFQHISDNRDTSYMSLAAVLFTFTGVACKLHLKVTRPTQS